jgi:hypothetical protein
MMRPPSLTQPRRDPQVGQRWPRPCLTLVLTLLLSSLGGLGGCGKPPLVTQHFLLDYPAPRLRPEDPAARKYPGGAVCCGPNL